jgi:hypothetical protein
LAVSVLLLAGASGHAFAFELPNRFLETAESGGGGGRLFTGSPIDHYTCKVCHTEGTPPHLKITGLPVDGYTPGQSYTIVIAWANTLPSVGLNFEITNSVGQPSGQFSVPTQGLTPADFCTDGKPTLIAQPMAGMRQFVLVRECGEHQATVIWTAPVAATDPQSVAIGPDALFLGSLVSSDKDGTVNGDSVTDFSRIIGLKGQAEPVVTQVSGGCQAVRTTQSPGSGAVVLYVAAALVCLRLRRRAGVCGARR